MKKNRCEKGVCQKIEKKCQRLLWMVPEQTTPELKLLSRNGCFENCLETFILILQGLNTYYIVSILSFIMDFRTGVGQN